MVKKSLGKATFRSAASNESKVGILTDGPCAEETLAAMERGDRGKPLGRMPLEAIRTQAAMVLESIVEVYSESVARGEVGDGGRARASSDEPIDDRCPTGLLYGRVQSGKTAAMIVTAALAIDNGFRVFVVLTSNNLKLVEQTADRFGVLDGALIYSSLNASVREYEWDRDRAHVQNFIGERGAVFVCAKEDSHLRSLIAFLQAIGATDYPSLILDDEADHATPDTQTNARSRGKDIPYSSTTFRLVVENDNPKEAGGSLRETLAHNVFLQVTATPYGLLLQNLKNPLRPAFTRLLEPGQGYTGGESFFARTDEEAVPPLVYVDEEESLELTSDASTAPMWLSRSIAAFLVSATANSQITGTVPRNGYKYLCHTSAKQAVHKRLEGLILGYVDALAKQLSADPTGAFARPELQWAMLEMKKTVAGTINEQSLQSDLARHLPRRTMIVVNSEKGAEMKFEGRYNFLVGGNILGRGLTIDDLLVTYYFRQARIAQMDTMHQHARMYGYREPLMPFTRVFLPRTLAIRFRQIHESEQALRELLSGKSDSSSTQVEVAGDLKPTRSNILDIGSLGAYRPGQQVYPTVPINDAKELGESVQKLGVLIARAFGGQIRQKSFQQVELSVIKEMISIVRVRDGDGDWHTKALLQVLDATASRYASKAFLFVRDFDREKSTLPTGAISGDEQAAARAKGAPVLFMFKGKKGKVWLADIWYPTVSFPADMPAIIFNKDV